MATIYVVIWDWEYYKVDLHGNYVSSLANIMCKTNTY